MIIKQKRQCDRKDIYSIRTPSESHIYWKKHFHMNPFHLRIIVDFEGDNETDNSVIGNQTTNIFNQKPVCNVYYRLSEMDNFLKRGCYESLLGYNIVDWFVNEV